MGKASWQTKKRYNDKTYGRITAFLPADLVDKFKTKCKEEGVSYASVIKKAVEEYIEK